MFRIPAPKPHSYGLQSHKPVFDIFFVSMRGTLEVMTPIFQKLKNNAKNYQKILLQSLMYKL